MTVIIYDISEVLIEMFSLMFLDVVTSDILECIIISM